MKKNIFLYILLLSLISTSIFAQRKRQPAKNIANNSSSRNVSISALKLRNIGPAFLSGRIADIAIHPENKNLWYVAVGSGGVWKTENSGTTWKPIFDETDFTSYLKESFAIGGNRILELDIENEA